MEDEMLVGRTHDQTCWTGEEEEEVEQIEQKKKKKMWSWEQGLDLCEIFDSWNDFKFWMKVEEMRQPEKEYQVVVMGSCKQGKKNEKMC